MMGKWNAIARAAACIAAILGAGCADGESPIAPQPDVRPSAILVSDATGNTFDLLQGTFPNPMGNGRSCDVTGKADPTPARLRSAAWIGPLGGVLTLPGGSLNGKVVAHVLAVPPLAVKKSTLFCMRLEPTNHMQLHLQAHTLDWKGNVVNVGAAGFGLPVTVTMSYVSLNLSSLLQPRVVVLYDPQNGQPFQKMPSVSLILADVVVATLPHFSKYAMAVD